MQLPVLCTRRTALLIRLRKHEKLPVAQVFLHDDPRVAVDRVDLRHRNVAVEKQPGYVEIRMKFGIERLRIDGGDRGALLPADAVILAR